MKILIVDDDEISLELLRAAVTQAGHEVEAARDGREALEKLRAGAGRLVISDWDMPVMDGEELCRAVRAEDFGGYVYIILLTCHGDHNYIVRGLSAGADDFVAKPFDPDELTVRIRAGERVLSLETRDVALFAMAKLAESRDRETGGHLERIQSYSRILTQYLGGRKHDGEEVDADYIRLVHLTSPLHDIGKVGIPDAVLLKPGRLCDREFEIMKTHAMIGAETLDAALQKFPQARFLRIARDIAATHHERYDGTGYPNRLKGRDIPLCGRIVALADVYDALTSKRVYKQSFPHEIAHSMIIQESGTHFDPQIVEAYIANEQQFIATHERFPEAGSAA